MKIDAINPNKIQKTITKQSSKKLQEQKNENSTSLVIINDSTKIPFSGNKKSIQDIKNIRFIQKNLTPEAQDMYDLAIKCAKQTGSSEVETWHFYLATLLTLKAYIKELDNGTIRHEDEQRLKTPIAIENTVAPNAHIFGNEKERAKVSSIIDKHIKSVRQTFKPTKNENKINIPFLSGPSLSKEAIEDLIETYDIIANQAQTNGFFDNYFFTAANYSKDKKLIKEARNLILEIQSKVMIEDIDKKKKNHLQFYDEKADIIWKNLSVGNDAICLYPSEDKQASKHLISSFVNLINKPNQNYKNIDPKNTKIITLKENATFEFLNKVVRDAKINPKHENKTIVFVANLVDLIVNSGGTLNKNDITTIQNMSLNKEGDSRNIRLVFTMSPEAYYANTAKNAGLAGPLSKYAVQTLPSLNTADATKFLTDENGVNYINNEIKTDLSKETIQKAIELTSQEEGSYPDKVLNLLAGAKNYYIDKEEITQEDLEKYTLETRGLSEISSSNNEIDITYDTGKRISDIVGSPMTKADAQAIVKQIKSKTIGTKGFSAYLENGTSYGGGRKHTAQAIAGEAGIPMITVNAQDFALKDIDTLSQNPNYSEMKIKKIISTAKAQAEANPNKAAMIFIENFDNFASNPIYHISSVYEQKAFSQLLLEMDNARKNEDISLIVVGSVNSPEFLDMNIMKPYKFLNSIIVYPPQDTKERQEVVKYYINKMNLKIKGETEEEKQSIIKNISETLRGFTVVDIIYLLETAKGVISEREKTEIDSSDFIEAYLRTTSGRPNQAYVPDSSKKIITSHEAGHATTLQIMYELAQKQDIEWRLPDKVNFITLDPRAKYGGAMYHKESENQQYNLEKIISDMICSYGGHSAENQIYNMSGSWGITGDMQSAEGMARLAVLDMGMGAKTGVRHIRRNALGSPDVSEEKLKHIEEDIDSLHKTAKLISDKIVQTYKDFILEFTEKYYSKVATGECLISSEEFINELNKWREKQPEDQQIRFKKLEEEILTKINDLKV